jgi:hypothetical protein
VPGKLRLGFISPVTEFKLNPVGALYTPPLKVKVPEMDAGCNTFNDVQKGVPGYVKAAVGYELIVTDVVTGKLVQPPIAGTVYVTMYVPEVLVLGVIAPVTLSIVNPGVDVKVPPVKELVPFNSTDCGAVRLPQ